MINLKAFLENTLFEASRSLFNDLNININSTTAEALPIGQILQDAPQYVSNLFPKVKNTYFIGTVDDSSFNLHISNQQKLIKIDEHYKGLLVFAIEIDADINLTRTDMASFTRSFNRYSKSVPVVLIIKYGNKIAFCICERTDYIRLQQGEKVGKVTILRDVDLEHPHRGHKDILDSLNASDCKNFDDLYRKWMNKFNISILNKSFYGELQAWFYWAVKTIKLPYKPDILTKEQNDKNFLVRLLSRTMFCWFLKERKLIDNRLLELVDFNNNRFQMLKKFDDDDFLEQNSYYRGILQNIFFNGLNKNDKHGKNDFKWCKYLPDDFDYGLFVEIPYLNGGTFQAIDEDNAKESIEDDVICIPNKLFYGDIDNNQKGLNQIFSSYKFTIEENTPLDEDIALDPEMLGMVFENLLAEIDPQNDKATTNSIRKATGSYYTPRPVIQEMVNESLQLYLLKMLTNSGIVEDKAKAFLTELIYHDKKITTDYDHVLVTSLYQIKILDPACGSGAFPMGMLQRIVDLLSIVDPDNTIWLEYMLQPIDDLYREHFKQELQSHQNDYMRKLGIIKNSIYGIDIQPIAIQITKLRFFISILADQKLDDRKPNKGITPLPNLETKIICADSLNNLSEHKDVFYEDIKKRLNEAREKYYKPDISHEEKEAIADEIAGIMDSQFPHFAFELGYRNISGQNKEILKRWFLEANVNAPFFDMETFFPEITEGFDIVIGNPPYGGFKIKNTVRDDLHLGSNDPYGAFISRFLGNGLRNTPLKDSGVLAFIVSDTFMTIGSHLKLRNQMMHNKIHKMIRMCPKTFNATVNTVIILCEKCKADKEDSAIKGNICQMVDMTNIDIHQDYEHFIDVLVHSRKLLSSSCESNAEYAIYQYPQTLINNCSNKPFFVASPKLFEFMNDIHPIKTGLNNVENKQVPYRVNKINDNWISFYQLGHISEVKVGLQTGDNPSYLYQNPEARGNYRNINEYKDFILRDDDLEKIHNNNSLRLEVIDKGINKDDIHSDRYFGGRYIVPYDKGGESDIDEGWIPNYYVPTNYYIDWSEWAVNRMKTLTIEERKIEDNELNLIKKGDDKNLAAVIRNPKTYFKGGISFSWTGVYCPSFRINEAGPYDHGASCIFIDDYSIAYIIALLSSKLIRYIMRTMINHSVNFGIEDMKKIPLKVEVINDIERLSIQIMHKQKENKNYDYATHEQREIDKLIYKAYGLNDDDIQEVEKWFVRRYPKLAGAQQRNLQSANGL